MRTIAALYVAKNGPYFGIEGVDPWDEERDARVYTGPHPVVAHPPCQRWGGFWKGQPGNIAKGKVERLGDDGGCFKAALTDVRRVGGVLEHPENSRAWVTFGIAKPPRQGGWIKADEYGGWTCRVEQGQYGHYCPKPTWLYAVGVNPLPDLRWGVHPTTDDDFRRIAPNLVEKHGIAWCRRAGIMAMMGGGRDSAVRIHTPNEFRNLLIAMARSVNQSQGTRHMKSDLVDISVQFQHQTEDAVCVRAVEGGEDIWIPKSQCKILQSAPKRGHYVLLTTNETTATQKGLV